jgi:hypothetical protein
MTKESAPSNRSKRTPQEKVVHYNQVCTSSRLPQISGTFASTHLPDTDYRTCRPTEELAMARCNSHQSPYDSEIGVTDETKYLNTKATLRNVVMRLHRIIANRRSQPTAPITITGHELALLHEKFLWIGQQQAERRWAKLKKSAGAVAALAAELAQILSAQGYGDKVLIAQLRFSPAALQAIDFSTDSPQR